MLACVHACVWWILQGTAFLQLLYLRRTPLTPHSLSPPPFPSSPPRPRPLPSLPRPFLNNELTYAQTWQDHQKVEPVANHQRNHSSRLQHQQQHQLRLLLHLLQWRHRKMLLLQHFQIPDLQRSLLQEQKAAVGDHGSGRQQLDLRPHQTQVMILLCSLCTLHLFHATGWMLQLYLPFHTTSPLTIRVLLWGSIESAVRMLTCAVCC